MSNNIKVESSGDILLTDYQESVRILLVGIKDTQDKPYRLATPNELKDLVGKVGQKYGVGLLVWDKDQWVKLTPEMLANPEEGGE